MTRKGKQILWHKKQGKIIPSKFSKIQSKVSSGQTPPSGDKIKDFARNLSAQIKKAARDHC